MLNRIVLTEKDQITTLKVIDELRQEEIQPEMQDIEKRLASANTRKVTLDLDNLLKKLLLLVSPSEKLRCWDIFNFQGRFSNDLIGGPAHVVKNFSRKTHFASTSNKKVIIVSHLLEPIKLSFWDTL